MFMRAKIIAFSVFLFLFSSCKKDAQTSPYYFTFQYENSNYSFDSAFATIIPSGAITINAYDTKTQAPLMTSVKEQHLQFQLTSNNSAFTGMYFNVPSNLTIKETDFSLFSGTKLNGSVVNGIAYLDTIPSLSININQMTHTFIQGTFSRNTTLNDSLIFLKVTNGNFNIPIR